MNATFVFLGRLCRSVKGVEGAMVFDISGIDERLKLAPAQAEAILATLVERNFIERTALGIHLTLAGALWYVENSTGTGRAANQSMLWQSFMAHTTDILASHLTRGTVVFVALPARQRTILCDLRSGIAGCPSVQGGPHWRHKAALVEYAWRHLPASETVTQLTHVLCISAAPEDYEAAIVQACACINADLREVALRALA